MYKIYTSYFSNKIFKDQNKKDIKIPICADLRGYYPFTKWYKELAPDIEWIKQYNNVRSKTKAIKEWFKQKYLKKLYSLKESSMLEKYVEELKELVQYSDVYLLCYEKPSEFCHRHILAEYLNMYYDLDITEY